MQSVGDLIDRLLHIVVHVRTIPSGLTILSSALSDGAQVVEEWCAQRYEPAFRPIREFVQRGGTAVVHVGLTNSITSAQAAEQLLLAGASVFGFETSSHDYRARRSAFARLRRPGKPR